MNKIMLLMMIPIIGFSQKSVMEFTPTQREVLQRYLQANSSVYFTSERYLYDAEYQLSKREILSYFGSGFKPYYNFNDFNGDGKKDFAVLFSKGRSRQILLIFNNVDNKSYRLVYKKEYEYDHAAFINRSEKWSRNHLYYAITASDMMLCFRLAGGGYIEEYCGR